MKFFSHKKFVAMIVALLSLAISRPDYMTSKFGHPGVDDVAIEFSDGFEILERNLPKQPTKPIRELNLTEPIDDDAYPWPGHDLTCDWGNLTSESEQIKNIYKSNNINESQRYHHPAAAKQYYTTFEELDKMERVKVKLTLTPKYYRHVGRVFMPPGEIVTITIAASAVNKVTVIYNKFMFAVKTNGDGPPAYRQRIDNMKITDIALSKEVNTLCSPYGAALTFSMIKEKEPIEMNISGGILCPYFKYGVDSDEEWEETLSKLPGPVAVLDTGNLLMTVHSKFVRSAIRMNDCMLFWRSVYMTSQTAAIDKYSDNPLNGRPLNACELNFDSYVPAGAAVAYVGANFCHFPPNWIYSVITWETVQDNPWGVVHEINHHHQFDWANGGVDEMSNNILNLLTYAKTNQASSPRTETGGLSDWARFSTSYQELNTGDEYGLSMYSTFIHFFGVDKMREYINADQANALYNVTEFGRRGAQMLKASKIFGRNLHYHFNFHTFNDSVIEDFNKDNKVWEKLAELNLPDFHPVTNAYACGFVADDGTKFETARPFEISSFPSEIDFVKTMNQRENKEWFGDFEFSGIHLEPGRESSWKQLGIGRYLVTPTKNLSQIEEVIVDYLDKTTQRITKVICKFKQAETVSYYKRFTNLGSQPSTIIAYNKTLGMEPVEEKIVRGIESPMVSDDGSGWVSITKGKLIVPETDDYEFTTCADDGGLLYLSENELAEDPFEDAPYLIGEQNGFNWNLNTCNHSKLIRLDENKVYHFIFVIHNHYTGHNNNQGRGMVAVKVGSGERDLVPSIWLRALDLTERDLWENQYEPNFTKMYYMDLWGGTNFIRERDVSKWVVYKHPPGTPVVNSKNSQGSEDKTKTITQVLTDGRDDTEYRSDWWRNQIREFPHVYEVDFGEMREIRTLKIGGPGNRVYFDTDSDIEIRLAHGNFSVEYTNDSYIFDELNYSLNHNESIIYTGTLNRTNEFVELSKTERGRYMRLTFLNNRAIWRETYPGKTCFSSIDIGRVVHINKVRPITREKNMTYSGGWTFVKDGIYYNGKGRKGSEGSWLKMAIPNDWKEVGIIGDLYPWMGSATVKIDGAVVGKIDSSLINYYDQERLNLATRSYKQLLFMAPLNKNNVLEITVDRGEIILSGFLVDEAIASPSDDYHNDSGSNQEQPNKQPKKKSNAGAIAGAVIGVIAVVVVAVVVFIVGKRNGWWRSREDSDIEINNFSI